MSVTMSAKTIRNALGLLQDDPDSEHAWSELRGRARPRSSEEHGDPWIRHPSG